MSDFNEMKTIDFFFDEAKRNGKHLKDKLRNYISIDIVMFSLLGGWISNIESVLVNFHISHLWAVVLMMIFSLFPKIIIAFRGLHSSFTKIDESYEKFRGYYKKCFNREKKKIKLSEKGDIEKIDEEKIDEEIKNDVNFLVMNEIIRIKTGIVQNTEKSYHYAIIHLNNTILCSGLFLINFMFLMILEVKILFWVIFFMIAIISLSSLIYYIFCEIKFRREFKKNQQILLWKRMTSI